MSGDLVQVVRPLPSNPSVTPLQAPAALGPVLGARLLAAQVPLRPDQPALTGPQGARPRVAPALRVHRQGPDTQVDADHLALGLRLDPLGRGDFQPHADVPVTGLQVAGHRADPAAHHGSGGADPDLADPGQADPALRDPERAVQAHALTTRSLLLEAREAHIGARLPTLEQEGHERLMQVRDGGLGGALGDVAEPTVLGCALELNDAAHQLGGADELAGLPVGEHLLLQGPVVGPATGAAGTGQGGCLTPVGVQAKGALAVVEARPAAQTNVRHLARLTPFHGKVNGLNRVYLGAMTLALGWVTN